jgi:Fic family protein
LPKPLPPEPPLAYSVPLVTLLAEADRALGHLDGCTTVLPNPDLFVSSFVRKEALLSSQIEGTQATLDDVFASGGEASPASALGEVVNYVAAMNLGFARLPELPLSLRLVREVHERLLRGVRGGDRTPGEFRRSQNWIGGRDLASAAFVPPPPHEMTIALGEWERYLTAQTPDPALVRCALLHAQFETIHPFLDGNGRVGRLLIPFVLREWGLLRRPILYLSLWFKRHRSEYYARLQGVRDAGDWEGWVSFFLQGVRETSREASDAALLIHELRERDLRTVRDSVTVKNAARLLDRLFQAPFVTVTDVAEALDVSQPTANTLVAQMERAGILEETTGRSWGRVFRYAAYLDVLRAGTEMPPG